MGKIDPLELLVLRRIRYAKRVKVVVDLGDDETASIEVGGSLPCQISCLIQNYKQNEKR